MATKKRLHIQIRPYDWLAADWRIQKLTIEQQAIFVKILCKARLASPPGQFDFVSWRNLAHELLQSSSDKTLKRACLKLQEVGLILLHEPDKETILYRIEVVEFEERWQGVSNAKSKSESIRSTRSAEDDKEMQETTENESNLRHQSESMTHSYPVEGVHKDKDRDKDTYMDKDRDSLNHPDPSFTYGELDPTDPSNGDGEGKGDTDGFDDDCSPLGEERDLDKEITRSAAARRQDVWPEGDDEENDLLNKILAIAAGWCESERKLTEDEVNALSDMAQEFLPILGARTLLRDMERWRGPNDAYDIPWYGQLRNWIKQKVNLKQQDR